MTFYKIYEYNLWLFHIKRYNGLKNLKKLSRETKNSKNSFLKDNWINFNISVRLFTLVCSTLIKVNEFYLILKLLNIF